MADQPPYDTAWVAQQLGQNERWVRETVNRLGVPHLRLGKRMAFMAEDYEALIEALRVQRATPTARSRARQRKGRAA